jgi:hypothetical protein
MYRERTIFVYPIAIGEVRGVRWESLDCEARGLVVKLERVKLVEM